MKPQVVHIVISGMEQSGKSHNKASQTDFQSLAVACSVKKSSLKYKSSRLTAPRLIPTYK